MTRAVADYERAFFAERALEFPEVDAFEARCGAAIDRERLEKAARVLACPVKANAPCWQHGRVIYAAAYSLLQRTTGRGEPPAILVDVGTAKGFSALCALWAARDSQTPRRVVSLDVIDPSARVLRNTVAEVDGPRTLREILKPWPETSEIIFLQRPASTWLASRFERVNFAFVDGKHNYAAVSAEAAHLGRLQRAGDVTVFDDAQIPGVLRAIEELDTYDVEYVTAKPDRKYAVAVRR